MRDGEAQLSLGSGWTRSGSLNQTSGHRQLSVISYQLSVIRIWRLERHTENLVQLFVAAPALIIL